MGRLLLAALVGGLLVFAWGSISWMVLPFHDETIHLFPGEQDEVDAFFSRVTESGLYHYPGMEGDRAEIEARRAAGPVVSKMIVYPDGTESGMAVKLGIVLLIHTGGALILAMMIKGMRQGGAPFLACVVVGGLFAVFAVAAAMMPNQLFWDYPRERVTLSILDVLIPWTLASIVMSLMLKPK